MDNDSMPQEVLFDSKTKNYITESFTKSDKNVTEEEFQNFMQRVTEVEKIIKQLGSDDLEDQKRGMFLADEVLDKSTVSLLSDVEEVKIKSDRTIINKYLPEDSDPNKMSQEAFKRSVELDAQKRAEDRKARNERAETYKRIGNGAYREANYEKAVTYFGKALEQRRDSSVLWNNRALAYMGLGLYEKALADCDWALRVNENNIKALLLSAKCHKLLGQRDQYRSFLNLARDRNPRFLKYISEYEQNLESGGVTESMEGRLDDVVA